MLSPDLACVGLSDEFGVDHWGLKIVKLVAYPDLILPTKPRSSVSSLRSTPLSSVLDKPMLPDLFPSFYAMTPSLSPSSPLSEQNDDGYFSHSPQSSPKYMLPKIPSRSHSDLTTLSLSTPSKHDRKPPPSSARSSGSISPTTESQVPFFSFTRTAEGSSLTTDVRLLATLFPPHERHMVICGAELDVADDDSDDELSDLHGSTLKCLQVDLRQFGLGELAYSTPPFKLLNQSILIKINTALSIDSPVRWRTTESTICIARLLKQLIYWYAWFFFFYHFLSY